MPVTVTATLRYAVPAPCDLLLQVEAAMLPEQTVTAATLDLPPTEHFARVAGQDAIGERIWLRHHGDLMVRYAATIEVSRQVMALSGLAALPPHLLPGEAVPYLFDSPYAPADRFQPFVAAEFAGLSGGALVDAIRVWIQDHVTYATGSSDTRTTALDTFVERRGVCRDFAHLTVALARAAAIPARYVSVYAPGVEPQDFHAVAEVFLASPDGAGGLWTMVDATGMADPAQAAKIAVGRDAADASFLTSYGAVTLLQKDIAVTGT